MEHFESSHSDKIRYQPPPLKSAFPIRDGAVKNTQHLLITAWTKSSSTTFQEYLPDHRTNYLSKSHGFKTWFTAAKTKLFWGINQPVLCNSGRSTSSWLQGNNKKWWTLVRLVSFGSAWSPLAQYTLQVSQLLYAFLKISFNCDDFWSEKQMLN